MRLSFAICVAYIALSSLGGAAAVTVPPASLVPALERLMDADSDRDGSVTRAEFLAWRSANFDRFDRNHDGLLSDADMPGMLHGTAIGARFKALKLQFDPDHDGSVTRAEYNGAPTPAFDMADTNHDKRLTRAELDSAIATARLAAAQ